MLTPWVLERGSMQAYVNLCSLEYVLLHMSQTCSSSNDKLSSGEEAWFSGPGYWGAVIGLLAVLEGAWLLSRGSAVWSSDCTEFMSPKFGIGVSVLEREESGKAVVSCWEKFPVLFRLL